jgi:tRNA (guanine-N7-)-methyltransferase
MKAAGSFIIEPNGLAIESLPRPIDWAAMYGNANPVELEIGMGKGTFLCEQAKLRPDVNFFGIEWANWFFRYAADRMRRHNLANARGIRADARFLLREYVASASLSALHVYFPDPWAKERQKKHRLIQPSFMPEVLRVLRPGARLNVVTDHQNYFEENIRPTLTTTPGLQAVEFERPPTAGDGEYVGTNFERKYRPEGRPIYTIAAVKVG